MPKPATVRRLWDAFAAECAASMKYTFYAQAARKEGYQEIADIFEETAMNEQAHARLWLLALGAFPDGSQAGDTEKNLRSAIQGERMEWEKQYKECAFDAKKDGEAGLEKQFEGVAAVEASHEERFRAVLARLEDGTLFCRPGQTDTLWRCRFCGHTQPGAQAPAACPVCAYPQGYFRTEAVTS